jgi:pimeloyl-ACP methyl ester carboxylesterase
MPDIGIDAAEINKHEPLRFSAKWEPRLADLKAQYQKFEKRTSLYSPGSFFLFAGFKRLFDFFLKTLCLKWILQPKQISPLKKNQIKNEFDQFWHSDSPWAKNSPLRKIFKAIPLELTTPDHVVLSATLFQHQSLDSKIPTVLLFDGNGSYSKMDRYRWMLENTLFYQKPFHFVIFDYRGTGESQGKARTALDLILDGETLYQFAKEHLQTPEESIYFYGYSLGGGVSAQVSALHPNSQRRHVFDRTFADIPSVVYAHAGFNRLTIFASRLVRINDWDLNTVQVWERLQGKKIIAYHPDDGVIPPQANLASQIGKNNPSSIVALRTAKDHSPKNAHCDPIIQYRDQRGNSADRTIMDFFTDLNYIVD